MADLQIQEIGSEEKKRRDKEKTRNSCCSTHNLRKGKYTKAKQLRQQNKLIKTTKNVAFYLKQCPTDSETMKSIRFEVHAVYYTLGQTIGDRTKRAEATTSKARRRLNQLEKVFFKFSFSKLE